jgi:hypothetical protein
LVTSLISSRSLKKEDFKTFDFIEKAYRARNNVAHEGRAYYEDTGSVIEVDAPRATEFMDYAEKAVSWLASL